MLSGVFARKLTTQSRIDLNAALAGPSRHGLRSRAISSWRLVKQRRKQLAL